MLRGSNDADSRFGG